MATAKILFERWKALDAQYKYGVELLKNGQELEANAKKKLGQIEADTIAFYDAVRVLTPALWSKFVATMTGGSVPFDDIKNDIATHDCNAERYEELHAARLAAESEFFEVRESNKYNAELVRDLREDAEHAADDAFDQWRKESGL